MPRLTASPTDSPRHASPRALPVLAGFAIGAVAGWLLGEWKGGVSRARVAGVLAAWRRPRPDPEAPATLRERVGAALAADPELRALGLRLVPAGRRAVELHGWVPSRRLRARATRLAATAATPDRLVDCLLVRGEDDRPAAEAPAGAGASRPA